MPRLSEAKKDVISCEKLRGSANRSYIRRCPNGATHHAEGMVSTRKSRKQTRGTETSKYPEEKKTTVIAQVVASERVRAQTFSVTAGEGL